MVFDLSNNDDQIAKQFDEIAYLYDELMAGVPYRHWANYILRIFRRFGRRPRSILDLCCGTGTMSILLAKKGFSVTGVDISRSMVEIAVRKAAEEHLKIDFHVQDATRLSLGRRFDAIVSVFDSLNYVLRPSDLENAFDRVSEHLEQDGLFIFDMNTELALAGKLFDQDNLGCGMPLEYVWRSSYDPSTRICTIDMWFTFKQSEAPRTVRVTHVQRAYETLEIVNMLNKTGLRALATYHAYTFKHASERSDRIFFVAEKMAG